MGPGQAFHPEARVLRSCRGIPRLLAYLPDWLGVTNHSFGFFHNVSQVGWIRPAAHLAFEDRGRICRDKRVPLQDKLWINPIACRLIDFVTTKVAIEFVFVIVIAAEFETFAVRRKFLFLIEHHHLRCAPWLTRLTNVTPKFVIGFVVTPPDVIIASRFSCDVLSHLDSRLLNSLGNGLAAGEEQYAE